jgi:NADH-quinone oxidoreductase subunit G
VRFSQEISEDYQLILSERGAHSYVSTFDGTPYVGPFSGNIIELCPVGALTSTAYRFRARPWDIEGAGTVCTYCPAQCNVELTVRDDRVMRVMARDNDEVDDGWLCDKGRFAYQSTHTDERITEPLVREGTRLMPASWEKALDAAASALRKAGPRAAALAGADTTNEEAFLLARLFRDGLGSGRLAGSPARALAPDLSRALADSALQAKVSDLEYADAVLVLDCDPVDDAPILDLRIRKGVRRNRVRLAVASARPGALDPNADSVLRYRPGAGEALLVGLGAALAGDAGDLGGAATAAGSNATAVRELAELLSGAGTDQGASHSGTGDVVIVYGERLLSGARGAETARALLNLATRLGLRGRDGAGLLEIPSAANGRGIREAGFAAAHGPGYADLDARPGDDAESVLYLLHADPVRTEPDRAAWEARLAAAQTVIVHAAALTDTVSKHADIVFPAEAYAEKEGTLVHPDGRVQRLRPAIGRPGSLGAGVRAGWQVIAEVARRAGHELGVHAGPMASKQLFDAVPFLTGLTLDELGGRGVRWPERAAAARLGAAAWELADVAVPPAAGAATGDVLRLGTWRSLWAAPEVDLSPALRFMRQQQVVELSPVDADRLGVRDGDRVEVSRPVPAGEAGWGNGTRVRGAARLRAAIPGGSVFLVEGTHEEPANLLGGPLVEVRRVDAGGEQPAATAALLTPAGGGHAEAPPSAPLEIPPTDPHREDGAA